MSCPNKFSAPLCLNRNREEFLQQRRIQLLEMIDEKGSILQAAKAVGLSYRAAWVAVNNMNNLAEKALTVNVAGGHSGGGTVVTEEGHRLIQLFRTIEAEHGKLLHSLEQKAEDSTRLLTLMRRMSLRLSAKNIFYGTICHIRAGELLAEISLHLKSGQQIYSVITRGSLDALGLAIGEGVYAVIKASSVIVAGELENGILSSRNILRGQVVCSRVDDIMGEVTIDIGAGDTLVATVSAAGVGNLSLSEDDRACAVIDAANVIIGVV
jgi:molybdate transport system regulatory protein